MSSDVQVETVARRLVDKGLALTERNVLSGVTLNAAASGEAIGALEAHLGRTLPPSLRELLSFADGAPGLFIFSDFLSIADMLPGSAAHRRAEVLKASLVDDTPLVPREALVIGDKRGDQPDCIYLDPRFVTSTGEWRAVIFDHEDDDVVFHDLPSLLSRMESRLDAMLADYDALGSELDELA